MEYSKTSLDYFTICASREYDPRLHRAFGSDSALVIWNVDEFAARLERAAATELAGWSYHYLPTEYFDPFRLEHRQRISTHFSKNFGYAYQREYRFMWMANPIDREMKEFFVEAGGLSDIATLVDAHGHHIGGRAL